MPVKHVSKTVTLEGLPIIVSVWAYECDRCGQRQAFNDSDDTPEREHGWRHTYRDDDGGCLCRTCSAWSDQRVLQAMKESDDD